MIVPVDEAPVPIDDLQVRYRVTRAALRAAKALTTPNLDPQQRLATLMECHGAMLAARGPGSPLTFKDFRLALDGDLAALLPTGVEAEDLEGFPVIEDGRVSAEAFDLNLEQRTLLRMLDKLKDDAGVLSDRELQTQIDQETAYTQLSRQGNQDVYVAGRSDLIRRPAGSVDDLCELRLPPLVADLYEAIPYASSHRGWWFACPVCSWPMRVVIRRGALGPVGAVRCWHGPHAEMGASYLFEASAGAGAPVLLPESAPLRPTGREAVLHPDVEEVPVARSVEGHKAIARGVWRYTTVPGLPELALHDQLRERGLNVQLWPGMDAYDLLVEIVPKQGKRRGFKVDVKDYTSATTLAALVHAQEGDRGGADWLVVPDYRATQVPLLAGVCGRYGMQVETASGFGEMVCAMAGVSWA